MKINESKLKEYLNNDEIERFDTLEEYLHFINEERRIFYHDCHPNDFTTFEAARALGWKYQFEHKGSYYWIYFDECLDIYEEE